jgi:hypothetical protein
LASGGSRWSLQRGLVLTGGHWLGQWRFTLVATGLVLTGGHWLGQWRFTLVATTRAGLDRRPLAWSVEVHAHGYRSSHREPPRDKLVASQRVVQARLAASVNLHETSSWHRLRLSKVSPWSARSILQRFSNGCTVDCPVCCWLGRRTGGLVAGPRHNHRLDVTTQPRRGTRDTNRGWDRIWT